MNWSNNPLTYLALFLLGTFCFTSVFSVAYFFVRFVFVFTPPLIWGLGAGVCFVLLFTNWLEGD
jgi:hypothetical protein